MRGYGGSSAPVEAEAHTPYQTVGDLVAILDVASVATASVVGPRLRCQHSVERRDDAS